MTRARQRIVVGASGTIGQAVLSALSDRHEIVKVGSRGGDVRMDLSDRESIARGLERIGPFDALAVAAGRVAFGRFEDLCDEAWRTSLENKLMGQVRLVRDGLAFVRDRGSFTLITGILARDPIPEGAIASAVNWAIESFVIAAATALPRGIRINAVSPTLLEESARKHEGLFPGFRPVPGSLVGQAYVKSIEGSQTGRIYRLD